MTAGLRLFYGSGVHPSDFKTEAAAVESDQTTGRKELTIKKYSIINLKFKKIIFL